MHQRRAVHLSSLRRFLLPVSVAVFFAAFMAIASNVYAGNSNPLCYLVSKGSIEWDVLLCNLTETPPGSEG